MVAFAWHRDSLIILQLMNNLNPYGSKLFFLLNGQMWLMVKLSAKLDIYLNKQRLWHNDQISCLNAGVSNKAATARVLRATWLYVTGYTGLNNQLKRNNLGVAYP